MVVRYCIWPPSRAVEIAGQAVTVVLGANAAELAPLLRHTPAAIVINRDWAEGMGSSVRTGVARVPAAADAALLMLADQPAVTAEDLRRLAGHPAPISPSASSPPILCRHRRSAGHLSVARTSQR